MDLWNDLHLADLSDRGGGDIVEIMIVCNHYFLILKLFWVIKGFILYQIKQTALKSGYNFTTYHKFTDTSWIEELQTRKRLSPIWASSSISRKWQVMGFWALASQISNNYIKASKINCSDNLKLNFTQLSMFSRSVSIDDVVMSCLCFCRLVARAICLRLSRLSKNSWKRPNHTIASMFLPFIQISVKLMFRGGSLRFSCLLQNLMHCITVIYCLAAGHILNWVYNCTKNNKIFSLRIFNSLQKFYLSPNELYKKTHLSSQKNDWWLFLVIDS